MRKVLFWIWTILWFIVLHPLVMVLQAATTPIELIIYCIANKTTDLSGYWRNFGTNMINAYSKYLDI